MIQKFLVWKACVSIIFRNWAIVMIILRFYTKSFAKVQTVTVFYVESLSHIMKNGVSPNGIFEF